MSKTLPIAVQVYSVREEAERDFAGTMKKLGEMGYDGVELAGLYGKSAEEIRDSIKAAGLTAMHMFPMTSWLEIWKRLCRTMRPSAAAIS